MVAVARELDVPVLPPVRSVAAPRRVAGPSRARSAHVPGGRGRPAPTVRYRRGRLAAAVVIGIVVAAALAGAAAFVVGGGASQEGRPSPPLAEPVTVVVGPGDTVWDLVDAHAPAGADRTAYAAEVAARNGVDPRALIPGMVLRLPAGEK
ncbi:MAG TPA: hypothetical protein VM324_11205 [Egibacteraceae bacterium]|jgi:hypothetical protein|nr:hypothetical protein [Egibacteraceae bacterium]